MATMATAEGEAPAGRRGRLAWLGGLWKIVLGVFLCLTPLTAILVLGWLQRWMQRETYRTWFKAAGRRPSGGTFGDFVAGTSDFRDLAGWPRWLLHQRPLDHLKESWAARPGLLARTAALGAAGFGSLAANLRLGLQALANLWALTLPAGLLWLFAWWGGWENSFNKGYEQYFVGPLIAWVGVALFLTVMIYVPLALARQAASGSWRAFYGRGFLWGLIRRNQSRVLGLAWLYALLALPLVAIKGAPAFVENFHAGFAELGPEAVAAYRDTWIFWWTLYLFLALLVLRGAAARIYARSVMDGLRDESIRLGALSIREQQFLRLLELGPTRAPRRPHWLLAVLRWGAGKLGRGIGWVLIVIAWFGVTFQLFFAQFLNHAWWHWVNHPLIPTCTVDH